MATAIGCTWAPRPYPWPSSRRVRAIPAALRLLVTDACRNYPTRAKGVTTEPGFAIASPSAHPADGIVWLYASGRGEPALESDELQGALFTYYWVSALRGAGDASSDGQVTLAESCDFAYNQTLLRSSRGVSLQHPAAPSSTSAKPHRSSSRSRSVPPPSCVCRAAPTPTSSSTRSARAPSSANSGGADHDVVFALQPGRYLVQRRAGAGSAAVGLAAGGSADARCLRVPGGARRGPRRQGREPRSSPRRTGPGVLVRGLDLHEAERDGRRALRASLGRLGLLPRGRRRCLGRTTNAADVSFRTLGGDAFVERRWPFGPLELALGAGGEAEYVWQKVERADAVRVTPPATRPSSTLAPSPREHGAERASGCGSAAGGSGRCPGWRPLLRKRGRRPADGDGRRNPRARRRVLTGAETGGVAWPTHPDGKGLRQLSLPRKRKALFSLERWPLLRIASPARSRRSRTQQDLGQNLEGVASSFAPARGRRRSDGPRLARDANDTAWSVSSVAAAWASSTKRTTTTARNPSR